MVWGLFALAWGRLHVRGRVGPTARAGLVLALYGLVAHEASRYAIEASITLLHRAREEVPADLAARASLVAATGLVAYGLGLGLAGVAMLRELRGPKARSVA